MAKYVRLGILEMSVVVFLVRRVFAGASRPVVH